MASLEKKDMKPKVRSAFVRELIVHMTSYGGKPSKNFCSTVARKIVLKYPFLRDAVGSGYVSTCNCGLNVLIISNSVQASWEKRLIGRVYNVSKGEKKRQSEGEEASPLAKKRPKLLDRYPPLSPSDITDESTHERHMKAIKDELARDKPRTCVLQELMELTFCHHREFVLSYATSVDEILMTYPALRQSDVVSTLKCDYTYTCKLIVHGSGIVSLNEYLKLRQIIITVLHVIVDYSGDGTDFKKREGYSAPMLQGGMADKVGSCDHQIC